MWYFMAHLLIIFNQHDNLHQKILSINAQLIISILMATFVYHLLLGELSFIRQFIPTLQKETAYLIVWDSFMTTYLILTVCMFVSIKSHEM